MEYSKLSAYDFELPFELIAQNPSPLRDASRLMVIHREKQVIEHLAFNDLIHFFSPNDQLILNTTKVLRARLEGRKQTGGLVEIFLSKKIKDNLWEALARPAKKLPIGTKIVFADNFYAKVIDSQAEGIKIVELISDLPIMEAIDAFGKVPLPPYIQRENAKDEDIERYQTVYADTLGAVAAPTAGLHFTKELLFLFDKKKIKKIPVTLHVGLGTFKPVQNDDITQHPMHSEWCHIPESSACDLNQGFREKRLQLAVGTTVCRTLETAADNFGVIKSGSYDTKIFIYPGKTFSFTRSLLTNFHLPRSTLLMLVSAFGGYELIREAYQIAIREKYRFYSYGDAMLII